MCNSISLCLLRIYSFFKQNIIASCQKKINIRTSAYICDDVPFADIIKTTISYIKCLQRVYLAHSRRGKGSKLRKAGIENYTPADLLLLKKKRL